MKIKDGIDLVAIAFETKEDTLSVGFEVLRSPYPEINFSYLDTSYQTFIIESNELTYGLAGQGLLDVYATFQINGELHKGNRIAQLKRSVFTGGVGVKANIRSSYRTDWDLLNKKK